VNILASTWAAYVGKVFAKCGTRHTAHGDQLLGKAMLPSVRVYALGKIYYTQVYTRFPVVHVVI